MTSEEQIEQMIGKAEANGISVAKLCRRADVDYSTVHRIRNGGDAKTSTLHKLSRALDALIAERKSGKRKLASA